MSDNDPTTTARKLAALPGFRWQPGMAWRRDAAGGQALSSQSGLVTEEFVTYGHSAPSWIPDLTHDANVGPLLSWLLGASGGHVYIHALPAGTEVRLWGYKGGDERAFVASHPSHALGLALVAVLGGSDV